MGRREEKKIDKVKRYKIKYIKILKRTLFYFIIIYLIFFFIVSLLEVKIAFEYDDVVVDSSELFEHALSLERDIDSSEYWRIVNNSFHLEKNNKTAFYIASFFKVLGFDIVFIVFRDAVGSEQLIASRRWIPDIFLFESKENMTTLFESANFQAYFYNSSFPNRDIIEQNIFLINYNNLLKYSPFKD